MQAPEIFFVNPNSLTAHPLLASIPLLDEASPEFQAMRASVRDRGVDYPVILDEDGRLLDGRNRARAAAKESAELPAMRRSSREAAEIILSSLLNRRHLPKDAQAYLAVPLMQKVVAEGRQRRLLNLRQSKTPKVENSTIGQTARDWADEMGLGYNRMLLAQKVVELFADTKKRQWHADGGKEVEATIREWFEPKLFAGNVGLGGIVKGGAYRQARDDKDDLAKRDLPTLLRAAFKVLKMRASRWEALSVEQRCELSAEAGQLMSELPEQLREAMLTGAEKAAVHPRKKSQF